MSVFALVDPLHLIHISDDGWLTRCGIRAVDAADSDDVNHFWKCSKCGHDKGTHR